VERLVEVLLELVGALEVVLRNLPVEREQVVVPDAERLLLVRVVLGELADSFR